MRGRATSRGASPAHRGQARSTACHEGLEAIEGIEGTDFIVVRPPIRWPHSEPGQRSSSPRRRGTHGISAEPSIAEDKTHRQIPEREENKQLRILLLPGSRRSSKDFPRRFRVLRGSAVRQLAIPRALRSLHGTRRGASKRATAVRWGCSSSGPRRGGSRGTAGRRGRGRGRGGRGTGAPRWRAGALPGKRPAGGDRGSPAPRE